MGLYYDSNGREYVLYPGSTVPSDAIGAVRESGGNGTPHFPGQMIQSNNIPVMSHPAEPVRRPDTPPSETPTPYSPHPYVGLATVRVAKPLPHDPSALLPPAYAAPAPISFGNLISNFMCFGRKGTLAFVCLMGLAELNTDVGKSQTAVMAEMRKSIPVAYSSIATPLVGNDTWGHNLIYGVPNKTPTSGQSPQARSVKKHR